MVNVSFCGTNLTIGDTRLDLNHEIRKSIVQDDNVIVLLEHSALIEDYQNRNIIGFNSDGEKIWQVDPSPGSDERNNQYTGIGTEEEEVIGYTWQGMSVVIDPETGAWRPHGLTK